jgi:hypothetical protein
MPLETGGIELEPELELDPPHPVTARMMRTSVVESRETVMKTPE